MAINEAPPVLGQEISLSGTPATKPTVASAQELPAEAGLGAIRQWIAVYVDLLIFIAFTPLSLLPSSWQFLTGPLQTFPPLYIAALMWNRLGWTPGLWLVGGRLVHVREDKYEPVGIWRGMTRYTLMFFVAFIGPVLFAISFFRMAVVLFLTRRVLPMDRMLGLRLLKAECDPLHTAS